MTEASRATELSQTGETSDRPPAGAAPAGASLPDGAAPERLLATLERLLELAPTGLQPALDAAAQLVAEALGADKVDAFLHVQAIDSLVAVGTSDTPMGRKQHAIGLDRLPLANGGRLVEVFRSGASYRTGRADEDPGELIGITRGLGIRSELAAPLAVGGEQRGLLAAACAQPERFTEDDLRFLEATARWVGIVAHRAELTERVATEAEAAARRTGADELIAIVAHDLNNLLAPLQMRLDLLRRRATLLTTEQVAAHAEGAAAAVERLRRFVGTLLDAERLERGVFAIAPERVDLAALARETAEAIAPARGAVRVEAPPELVAPADAVRVRQALENLLANALRHSPPGGEVLLAVAAETLPPAAPPDATAAPAPSDVSGPCVVLSVTDQGPGIPPEVLPRLFERFARGTDSAGLGLGLYIAHQVAAAHGGRLTVETARRRGACFRFVLPAAGPTAP
jgi:signal transduction histidine kinase